MLFFVHCNESGGDRFVKSVEQGKGSADYVAHWHVGTSGKPPKVDLSTPWVDGRSYGDQRAAAYSLESDPLYVQYQADVLDGVADATAKQPWIDKRAEIKNQYLKPWASCVADSAADKLTATDHGFVDDDKCEVQADTLPGGLSAATDYWVVGVAGNDWQLSTSQGGAAIDITSAGTNVEWRKKY